MEIDQGNTNLKYGSGCGFTMKWHHGICVTRIPGNVSGGESGAIKVEHDHLRHIFGSPACGFTLTGPTPPSKYGKLRSHSPVRTRSDSDPLLKVGFSGWSNLGLCMQVGIGGGISGDETRTHMMTKNCKSEIAKEVSSRKLKMQSAK